MATRDQSACLDTENGYMSLKLPDILVHDAHTVLYNVG